ncbi:DUF1801 domain-containing protein [Sphingomonas sp. ASV193]|uniref:DUF1801 domain-containing protein n=1 Tax=Sphingomonas sp. ASV193 TaxID=3144405 RepID=UPI0032E8B58B
MNEFDEKLAAATDWRGDVLRKVRAAVRAAVADVTEELKWKKPSNPAGVPTWSKNGVLLTGETYKDKVKLTFAHGAKIDDPDRLFNASLDGGTRRAIDLREGDPLDAGKLEALVARAAAFNAAKS